jgi:exonuclease III
MNEGRMLNFLTWNVRGLNDQNKKNNVKKHIQLSKPHVIALQETKLSNVTSTTTREVVGGSYDMFLAIEAQGASGGMLLTWKSSMFTKLAHNQGIYTLSVDLANNSDDTIFRITTVYGPTQHSDRHTFFSELRAAKPTNMLPWIVTGDFNVTLNPLDRSNQNHTQHEMRQFQAEVHNLELIDLTLKGRKFTWSSERENPTFVRLDRFLISTDWAQIYPNTTQRALPHATSDHCPILCMSQTKFPCPNTFKIENFWLHMTDFTSMVVTYWQQQSMAHNPNQLHKKLIGLRQRIIQWKRSNTTVWKKQMNTCLECLQWLDTQAEQRRLNAIERFLRPIFKERFQQLADQEEHRWKQRAKRDWIKLGDRNTRYFHQLASQQKKKKSD